MKKPIAIATIVALIATATLAAPTASEILEATGVKGGLVVHIGCGDGRLTAALRAGPAFVVHGLDPDPGNVEKARAHIRSLGLYGPVSVARLRGKRLPYVDNLVNLVVAEDLCGVPVSEVQRVLRPLGVAYVRRDGRWTRIIKPWPDEIDQWTHYLHDPQGTMVSLDRRVGLPRRLQWVGEPKWLRNHDFMSSLNGLVSANGRIFYIIDEGLRRHIYLPGRWALVARDGFNGKVLWKRRIARWFPHTWPFKSGPAWLPRRVVAAGERVFATLGIDEPLSLLDAATGKTIKTYEQTRSTEEIVFDDGTLFLVVLPNKKPFLYKHASTNRGKERTRVNTEFGWSKSRPPRVLMALDAATGRTLWKANYRIAPLTLAVDERRVYFFDGENLVALDRRTGRQAWVCRGAGDWSHPGTGYSPRLIVAGDVVVLSSQKGRDGRLVGVNAETGKLLWRASQPKSGHWSPEDLFLIRGALWTAETGGRQSNGTHFIAYDARTGQVEADFVAEQLHTFFMHQRCYPGRATVRYIMTSGTGTEFLPVGTRKCIIHHWLRGSCIYGLMPANGLLYKPPDTCACYYQSKLQHFCALAPEGGARIEAGGPRLEKGPAYGHLSPRPNEQGAWPTYRHDPMRSGATDAPLPDDLAAAWERKLGGRLTAPVVADGKVFVAAIDHHTLHALDARTGRPAWRYTAGGRVDSPPTVYRGMVLFGCADGWLYCLRSTDGQLVWRLRAAPADDKLLAYDQVESVWPLHGSVLVRDGVVYAVAGRNLFLDGGARLVRVECTTGRLLSETTLDDKDPRTGTNLQTLIAGKSMPVANTDILSCYRDRIYMRAQEFNLEGKRTRLEVARGKERDQAGPGRHLFCPTGFLDDWWFHRSYFIFGKNAGEGHGEYPVPRNFTPTGRQMVFDDGRVYAFFALNVGNNINPRTSYLLYAASKDATAGSGPAAGKARQQPRRRRPRGVPHLWEVPRPPLLANAMVLAGGKLVLAGPPDLADEEKTFDYVFGKDDDLHRQLTEQEQAWLGRRGGILLVVDAQKGARIAQRKLDTFPVWDGMAAAYGKLFIATVDGRLLCLGEDQ